MKPTILMIQWIALLLAFSGGGESSKTDSWTCYSLEFGPGVKSPWEGLPPADEPVMLGRLAIPSEKLPADIWNPVEGRLRLEPVDGYEFFDVRRGQHQVRIYTDPDGRIDVELTGRTTHNTFTLSQFDGNYSSADYAGRWTDWRGWSTLKTGVFSAELVPAYSLANCLSMKPAGDQ